jgi:hypothetical protein
MDQAGWDALFDRFKKAVERSQKAGYDDVTLMLSDAVELQDAIYEMDRHLPDFFQG